MKRNTNMTWMFHDGKPEVEPKNETEWFEERAKEVFQHIGATDFDVKAKSSGDAISPICVYYLGILEAIYTPQRAFEKYTEIEKDKVLMKKELKILIKKIYDWNMRLTSFQPTKFDVYGMIMPIVMGEDSALFQKYLIDTDNDKDKAENENNEAKGGEKQNIWDRYIANLQFTFPDLFYMIAKKQPTLGFSRYEWISRDYKNFPLILINVGMLSLLPKGKKYGGYVKVVLHSCFVRNRICVSMEAALASGLNMYMDGFVAQDKRVEWFEKLQINENDCALWSQVYNQKFPEYTDIHMHFDQIA